MNISEESELLRKLSVNSDDDEVEGLTEERVEAWLDRHEEFVTSYFSRKANRFLLDSFLRPRSRPSRTSSPLPGSHENSTIKSQSSVAGTPPGCSTPVRKISSSDFDKGYLKPIISHVDGFPSFLHFERSLSRPSRQRKSKEELQELKILDEQALLIELVKDIANDLEISSLCHKILQNVSILTDGDRCSLFLVQDYGAHGPKLLVSKVYDVNADSCVEEVQAKEEIIIQWGTGIVGYVAEHGETVNIPDAYSVSKLMSVYTFFVCFCVV